jgi:hypothetical protein
VPKLKILRKIFRREEKRRKELPLELKQKVSYEIVQLLLDLGDNSSFAQQRGILTFSYLVGFKSGNSTLFYVQRNGMLDSEFEYPFLSTCGVIWNHVLILSSFCLAS